MQVIALKSMGHHGVGGGCIGDIVKMVDSINVSNCVVGRGVKRQLAVFGGYRGVDGC